MNVDRVPGCFACDSAILPIPSSVVGVDDDLPLCTRHWNWWLTRWINSEDDPPCSAHLMEGQP